eukprot:TRINITY_DN14776_c0_g1_i1.p1 TRINITY_DN14776_c0_g1~~TRINITY_DN14776_c0_g1_i1.p1  ORF type:complete len:408 (+),score=73.78 TRINITY_DN14776_c0_g1_i1:125-1225(+)
MAKSSPPLSPRFVRPKVEEYRFGTIQTVYEPQENQTEKQSDEVHDQALERPEENIVEWLFVILDSMVSGEANWLFTLELIKRVPPEQYTEFGTILRKALLRKGENHLVNFIGFVLEEDVRELGFTQWLGGNTFSRNFVTSYVLSICRPYLNACMSSLCDAVLIIPPSKLQINSQVSPEVLQVNQKQFISLLEYHNKLFTYLKNSLHPCFIHILCAIKNCSLNLQPKSSPFPNISQFFFRLYYEFIRSELKNRISDKPPDAPHLYYLICILQTLFYLSIPEKFTKSFGDIDTSFLNIWMENNSQLFLPFFEDLMKDPPKVNTVYPFNYSGTEYQYLKEQVYQLLNDPTEPLQSLSNYPQIKLAITYI